MTLFSHENKILQELRYESPIIIRGNNSEAGHIWIIDGYKIYNRYETKKYTWFDQYGNITKQYYEDNIIYGGFSFLHHAWGQAGHNMYHSDCHISINSSIKYDRNKELILCSKK